MEEIQLTRAKLEGNSHDLLCFWPGLTAEVWPSFGKMMWKLHGVWRSFSIFCWGNWSEFVIASNNRMIGTSCFLTKDHAEKRNFLEPSHVWPEVSPMAFGVSRITLPFPPCHLLQIHPACQEDSLHRGTRLYYGYVPTGCHRFLISG